MADFEFSTRKGNSCANFDIDIQGWDISKAENISILFESSVNYDIDNKWDIKICKNGHAFLDNFCMCEFLEINNGRI